MINLIIEDTTEVDVKKLKDKKSVSKRKHLAPNAAEQNVFSNVYSKSSYDNYGNHQPFGTKGAAHTSLSSSGSSSGSQ